MQATYIVQPARSQKARPIFNLPEVCSVFVCVQLFQTKSFLLDCSPAPPV